MTRVDVLHFVILQFPSGAWPRARYAAHDLPRLPASNLGDRLVILDLPVDGERTVSVYDRCPIHRRPGLADCSTSRQGAPP